MEQDGANGKEVLQVSRSGSELSDRASSHYILMPSSDSLSPSEALMVVLYCGGVDGHILVGLCCLRVSQ